jgi:cbb3-type cytochrome oxidase maturation protein
VTFVFITAFATVLGLSAVCALFWCVRSGQMQDFRAGARSIFDDDEPIGEVTDRFPSDMSARKTTGAHP